MHTGLEPSWRLVSDWPDQDYIYSCALLPHTSPLMPQTSHPAEEAAQGCMFPTLRERLGLFGSD